MFNKEGNMAKKNFNPVIIGVMFISMVLISAWNVKAYEETKKEERIYKTDRTLIKEVIANQKKTHALLNEIKAAL